MDSLAQLCPAGELQPPSTAANQISTSYATCQTWLVGLQLRASAQPSFQQFVAQEGPADCCCCYKKAEYANSPHLKTCNVEA